MLQVAILLFGLLGGAALAETIPEPDGYRDAPYQGAVPVSLAGATTVSTGEAHRLWEEGEVAFVDVLPREKRPAELPEGTIWRDRPRDSIPGATWLPNVGYAELSPEEEAYFQHGLTTVTGGDFRRPVLFFCREECWMSWNAAKRALVQGQENVYWYPGGTDAWVRAGHATELVDPLDPS